MIKSLKPWTGIGLKVVERSGDKLEDLLHRSDPWQDQDCMRSDCPTCTTSVETENNPFKSCKKRSVIYETWCETCLTPEKKETNMLDSESDLNLKELFSELQNEVIDGANKKKRKLTTDLPKKGPHYRYIGESSRSVYERGTEHVKDLQYKRMKSHMLKHCVLKHQNMEPNSVKFRIKVLSNHKSAFERQIREAVLIHRFSGPLLMNSKSEYNRCIIPRISIKMGGKHEEDPDIALEQDVTDKIRTLYPENKKRTSKESEAVSQYLEKTGKNVKKRRKLDLPQQNTTTGNLESGNQVTRLPLPTINEMRVSSQINLQINLQNGPEKCDQQPITISDCILETPNNSNPSIQSESCDQQTIANSDCMHEIPDKVDPQNENNQSSIQIKSHDQNESNIDDDSKIDSNVDS